MFRVMIKKQYWWLKIFALFDVTYLTANLHFLLDKRVFGDSKFELNFEILGSHIIEDYFPQLFARFRKISSLLLFETTDYN